jgi:hypothetical protein
MTILVAPARVVVQLIPRKRALKISIHLGLAIVMTAGIITTYLGQMDKVGVGATIWHTDEMRTKRCRPMALPRLRRDAGEEKK